VSTPQLNISGTLAVVTAPQSPPARPIRITQRAHLPSFLVTLSPLLVMLLLIHDFSMDFCSGRLICTRFKVFGFNRKKWLKVFSTPNYLFACNIKEYWLYMIRCCSCSCKVQTGRWMMVRSSGIMPTPFLFATSWSTTFSQWSLMYILITIFPWNYAGILVLFAGRPSQRHNRSTDPPKTNYHVSFHIFFLNLCRMV
jgi:hypothetical protein